MYMSVRYLLAYDRSAKEYHDLGYILYDPSPAPFHSECATHLHTDPCAIVRLYTSSVGVLKGKSHYGKVPGVRNAISGATHP
jgi:hypothetical protein